LPAFPIHLSSRHAATLLVAIVAGTELAAEDPTPPAGPAAAVASSVYQGTTPQAPALDDDGRAERMVSACLAGLARHESIFARLRQTARVGEREMFGAGLYEQAGLGEDQRFRFESSLTVGDDTYSLLEVCDGLAFWSYQKNADLAPTVHRVDARRVRAALAPAQGQQGQSVTSEAITHQLGGVQRTLSLIRERFRFAAVEPSEIDGMPIWRIEGRWDRDELVRAVPELKDHPADAPIPPEALPKGLPWSVVLSLGKRELFPFRIEWFARAASGGDLERVAVVELYDVRIGEAIDATAFVYKPAAEGLMDVTDAFIAAMRPQRP
jgi:hypothetical protein